MRLIASFKDPGSCSELLSKWETLVNSPLGSFFGAAPPAPPLGRVSPLHGAESLRLFNCFYHPVDAGDARGSADAGCKPPAAPLTTRCSVTRSHSCCHWESNLQPPRSRSAKPPVGHVALKAAVDLVSEVHLLLVAHRFEVCSPHCSL